MTEQAKIPAPNYTQIPNAILDLMAEMSEAELRVILAIARQTFGWHKKRDKISLSQLERLTGMSRQGVVNGLEAGKARGLIVSTPDASDKRGGIWYRLLVNEVDQSTTLTSDDVDQSTTLTSDDVDQSTRLTRSSQRRRPDLVNDVDTQKKEKERKERESERPAPAHPALQILGEFYPDIRLTAQQVKSVATVADLTAWRSTVKLFADNGWKALIGNLLERYQKALAERTDQSGYKPAAPSGPSRPIPTATRPDLPDNPVPLRDLAAAALAARKRGHDAS